MSDRPQSLQRRESAQVVSKLGVKKIMIGIAFISATILVGLAIGCAAEKRLGT